MKSYRNYLYGMLSLWQMGLGKRAGLAILLGCFLALSACASRSQLTNAYNVVNAVSAVRNGLQPIYAKVVQVKPELADEIEAFDKEFHDGLKSAYETLILIGEGSGTFAEYRAKIAALVNILERHKVEERIPELKPGIDLVKRLLGVV